MLRQTEYFAIFLWPKFFSRIPIRWLIPRLSCAIPCVAFLFWGNIFFVCSNCYGFGSTCRQWKTSTLAIRHKLLCCFALIVRDRNSKTRWTNFKKNEAHTHFGLLQAPQHQICTGFNMINSDWLRFSCQKKNSFALKCFCCLHQFTIDFCLNRHSSNALTLILLIIFNFLPLLLYLVVDYSRIFVYFIYIYLSLTLSGSIALKLKRLPVHVCYAR